MESAEATTRQNRLIDSLCRPAVYPHPVDKVERLETHISVVLLAGEYAYKIKKPVNLGFLDFSNLDQRRFFCDEELRLNRRLSPEIYLRRIAVGGTPARPRLCGADPAQEYAVMMRRFPQDALLDRRLRSGRLRIDDMHQVALRMETFHRNASVAPPDSPYGTLEAIADPMRENISQLDALDVPVPLRPLLDSLKEWSERTLDRLTNEFEGRKQAGKVRECHGDLHLGNMASWNGKLFFFDCIEFSPALRWIDVMSELAFAVMDLEARGNPAHAHRLLNGYLEAGGDYAGLRVLPFYLVYRALVRAKIHALRAAQVSDARQRDESLRSCVDYVRLAARYTAARSPAIVITHGFSGSGKTTLAREAVDGLGFVSVRSDVERKRLAGLRADARTDSEPGAGLYDAKSNRRTYDRLADLSETIASAGWPVIADAAFLKAAERGRMRQLAFDHGWPFRIICVEADQAVLRSRITARSAIGNDASEATPMVLQRQLEGAEALSEIECAEAISVRSDERTADVIGPLGELLDEQRRGFS